MKVHDTNSDEIISRHEFFGVYLSLWGTNDFFRKFALRALHWLHLDENQDDTLTHSEILRLYPTANLTDIPESVTYELRIFWRLFFCLLTERCFFFVVRNYDSNLEYFHDVFARANETPFAVVHFDPKWLRPAVSERVDAVSKPFTVSFDHSKIVGSLFVTLNGTGFVVTRGARAVSRVGPDRKSIGCGSSYNIVTGEINDKDERGRSCNTPEFDVSFLNKRER